MVKHVGEVGVVVRARWGVGYRWANGVMGVETVIVVDVWMNCENGYGCMLLWGIGVIRIMGWW